MNQATWQQAKQIFYEALALSPAERDEFVKNACAGNGDLLEQVKILLESYESGFLEKTAVEDIANVLIESQIKTGQKIGRYRIQSLLGAGGMGEVFLAFDTELKRPVALKVLHPEVADDKERVNRFIQEAHAVSALNHPNILTIYEIGEFEGTRFIVSEYVKGETLRERLRREKLSFEEALEIAVQISAGLNAAHSAGVIHRDIKPENIILREDKLIKILDFGLAKLTAKRGFDETVDAEASTKAAIKTAPGMVMGTVAYMSPEQARGKSTDARTDLWSLGVVLYEMLSGKMPFEGETTSDIIAAILKTDAVPVTDIIKNCPPELESIIHQTLKKDLKSRYQTAEDLLADLKRLKKRLEIEAELELGTGLAKGQRNKNTNPDEIKTELIRHRPTSSREYIVGKVKEHKVGFSVLIGILILTLGVGVGSYWLVSKRSQTEATNSTNNQTNNPAMQITRLTNSGKEIGVAISPDGKYVANFTPQADGKYSLVLRQISTSGSRELDTNLDMPNSFSYLPGGVLTFSPNGEFIYYIVGTTDSKPAGLYRIPIVGGEPVRLLPEIPGTSSISFSPEGDRLAYAYFDNNTGDTQIRIASLKDLLEGRNNFQSVATRQLPQSLNNVAWSPDGSLIVCKLLDFSTSRITSQLIGFTPEGKEQEIPGKQNFVSVNWLEWEKNTGDLLLTAKKSYYENDQIWRLGKNGEARRITNELNWYDKFSVSADGKTLAALQSSGQLHLYVSEASGSGKSLLFDSGKFKQITNGINIYNGVLGVAWTPNGQIISDSSPVSTYSSWNPTQIFQINADGSGKKQLIQSDLSPKIGQVTPDGHFLLFDGTVNETGRIFRFDLSSGILKQLTPNESDTTDCCPSITSDGQNVIYSSINISTKLKKLRNVSIEGGEPVDLTDETYSAEMPNVSPDGTLVFFGYFYLKSLKPFYQFGLLPLSNTKGVPKLFPAPGIAEYGFRWTPDGGAFVYVYKENNTMNLRAVPIDGSKPFNLTNFTDGIVIYSYDFSKDGKRLVISLQSPITSDIALIKNFY